MFWPMAYESAKISPAHAWMPAPSGRVSETLAVHAYRTIRPGVKSRAKSLLQNPPWTLAGTRRLGPSTQPP